MWAMTVTVAVAPVLDIRRENLCLTRGCPAHPVNAVPVAPDAATDPVTGHS